MPTTNSRSRSDVELPLQPFFWSLSLAAASLSRSFHFHASWRKRRTALLALSVQDRHFAFLVQICHFPNASFMLDFRHLSFTLQLQIVLLHWIFCIVYSRASHEHLTAACLLPITHRTSFLCIPWHRLGRSYGSCLKKLTAQPLPVSCVANIHHQTHRGLNLDSREADARRQHGLAAPRWPKTPATNCVQPMKDD